MRELLKEHNIKVTKSRLDILELLDGNDPMTADEIYMELRDKDAKLSSIYRNLSLFVDNNILTKIVGIDNFAYYQMNTNAHKHHITCKICKKTVPLEYCPVHDITHKIEEETHFVITNHIFEFVGICPSCQKKLQEDSKK